MVLENNFFEFEDKVFKQKLGTAIGTKFAQGFANIFIRALEKRLLDSSEITPWIWWRFLDDIFVIWLHSYEELEMFLARLNRFHENVKFTWEIAYDRIAFLDVTVVLTMGEFSTDVYCKPTDAHQYLNFRSCPPPHVKRGIPYGQGLRLKRICSSDEVFERRLGDLKGFLVERGYDHDFIDSQFCRVRNHDRRDLLESKKKPKSKDSFGDRVCCVFDYHPAMGCLNQIFEQLQGIVSISSEFAKVLKEKPLLSFRRPKNLKDHLVRSKLRREGNRENGMVKCNKKRCQVCNFIRQGDKFRSSVTGKTYYVNHVFDCDSEGVIYLITCKKCVFAICGKYCNVV